MCRSRSHVARRSGTIAQVEPGQLALVPVTFIEEREGLAVVRLPNGSKTTLAFDALEAAAGFGHYVPDDDGSGVTAHCLHCHGDGWSTHEVRWIDAHRALVSHEASSHP